MKNAMVCNRIGFLIVGSEILQGFTIDTNSNFLAQHLTQMGHVVERIITVPDESRAIVLDLRALIRSDLDIIFISGGLGTTPDDVTMGSVSKALGLPLTLSRKAHGWIRSKVERLHAKGIIPERRMTAAVRKMAMVPKGAQVLYNGPGAAPGVIVRLAREGKRPQLVIILPGVPSEFKYLITEHIGGGIIKPSRNRPSYEEITVNIPESTMDAVLRKYTKEVPEVSLGSYPQDDKTVILRVSGPKAKVKETLRRMKADLKHLPPRGAKKK